MKKICGPFSDVETFTEWLGGVGNLRIFWAKPVSTIDIVSDKPPIFKVMWRRSRSGRGGVIIICPSNPYHCLPVIEDLDFPSDLHKFIFTYSEDFRGFDRWSKVWIYDVGARFLEPNGDVYIEVYRYDTLNKDIFKLLRSIQRESWGFYVEPPRGDYVLIGYYGDEPVASAYYNPVSSNVDYGIHVVRRLWRNRIGTSMLRECSSLASIEGWKWFSVVRVLRGVKPKSMDLRAISFYRANNPCLEINIYRLS